MPNPGRWQLKPCGKTGGSSVHPTAGFFLLAAASFAQDPLPCTDHSLAGGFLEVQQWGNLHQSCLGSADGKLVKLVKIVKKGLKEYAISPAEFSCQCIWGGQVSLLMSQQSPDFQPNFRRGESRETPHSHGQVKTYGGRVKQQI